MEGPPGSSPVEDATFWMVPPPCACIRRSINWNSRRMAATLCQQFADGELSEVYIIYTRMEEHGEEAPPVLQKLLPLSAEAFRPGEDKPQKPQQVNYLPDAGAVLGSIAPNYVTGYLFGALGEA